MNYNYILEVADNHFQKRALKFQGSFDVQIELCQLFLESLLEF
jgi:hypothetical protein